MNGSTFVIESKGFYFQVTNGQFTAEALESAPAEGTAVVKVVDGVLTNIYLDNGIIKAGVKAGA